MKHGLKAMVATLALLAGCAQNPMTGRSQLMLVSEDSAISQARLAYVQELDPWKKKGKLDNDPATKARIERITGRLVAQAIRYRPETAKWDWQVAVIDDPETLNAYCLPGGRMAIYTGLIDKLHATDDEIAEVMGHEIGHALANHGAEKMSQAMLAQGAVLAAGMASSENNRGAVLLGGTALAQLGWLLPNSRQAETEADAIGIALAARAGYDPDAGVSLWRKMKSASGGKSPPEWLSTHPATETRLEHLARLAKDQRPVYAEAKRAALPTFPLSGGAAGSGATQAFSPARPR
jgi:predicted Zn-dependent protease